MTDRRTLLIGVAASLCAGPAFAAGARFKPLFDGQSLAGWDPLGDANWRVEEGAIIADSGPMSFLVSRDSYRDFDLRAEFWASAEANSGIFIRCSDRTEITAKNAYEVNIFDTRPDPSYGTASIVDVAKVSPMPKAGGQWNTMLIEARGDRFTVTFNGKKTVDGAKNADHATGPIALQYGAGTIKFRKIEMRAL
jgi:hypothetical protein